MACTKRPDAFAIDLYGERYILAATDRLHAYRIATDFIGHGHPVKIVAEIRWLKGSPWTVLGLPRLLGQNKDQFRVKMAAYKLIREAGVR